MKISEIVALGLWPDSKKTTSQKGISELEDLGYNLFYIGKNADLYTCPGADAKVLLVRSDRCSVFYQYQSLVYCMLRSSKSQYHRR